MNDSHPYLAVVPAYNESATVGRVIRSIREHAPLYDVVVVDDGSTDATAAEAEAAGAKVIRHPYNLGIGGAVQSGFTYALENGYRRLVQVDADGQHEPSEIAKLEAAMDDDPSLDMVCGSRFREEGQYAAPISRRAADPPPHRLPHLRLPRLPHRRAAGDRPHRGVPPLQPARHRPVRARLPARLPRGRGRPDGPLPPSEDAGNCGEDVPARRRCVVDPLREVDLLHAQGAARDRGRLRARATGDRGR